MAHSPLARASETASIIWAGNEGARESESEDRSEKRPPCAAVVPLPSLREIDLHSFQGLLKSEGFQGRHAAAYARWKSNPEGFQIDGRFPVRDLWGRAGEAWRELLEELLPRAAAAAAAASSAALAAAAAASPSSSSSSADPPSRFLVVAHNAVNQALVSSALGFPPRAFRRLVQSNGCVTELELRSAKGRQLPHPHPYPNSSSSFATVLRLNVGPSPPLELPERGGGVALVVLVSVGGRGKGDRASSSLARALFGGEEGGGAAGSGRLPAEAPLVLSDSVLVAAAEAAGFDREAVARAAAARSERREQQRRQSPSPSSSSPAPVSFWRASAAAAAASPLGVAIALGSRQQVEEALRESLSDLFVEEEGEGEGAEEEKAKTTSSPSYSSSSPPSSPSCFLSAPAGGVSVVEVDSAAVAAGFFAGTVRCANWRPRPVRNETGDEASSSSPS